MEVKYKFRIANRYQITGIVCYTNSRNPYIKLGDEIKLTRLLVQRQDVNFQSDNMRIENEPKFVYELRFLKGCIKVVENTDRADYTVMLEGTNEQLLEEVYNHFIEKTLPDKPILTILDDELYELHKDSQSGGYLLLDYRSKEALKFVTNSNVQEFLAHSVKSTNEEYLMVTPNNDSSAQALIF
jgi:hypothetical protein